MCIKIFKNIQDMYIKISFKWKCSTGESLKMKKPGYFRDRNIKPTIGQVKATDGSNIRLVSFLLYLRFYITWFTGIHALVSQSLFLSYFPKNGDMAINSFSLSISRSKRATYWMLAISFTLHCKSESWHPAYYDEYDAVKTKLTVNFYYITYNELNF